MDNAAINKTSRQLPMQVSSAVKPVAKPVKSLAEKVLADTGLLLAGLLPGSVITRGVITRSAIARSAIARTSVAVLLVSVLGACATSSNPGTAPVPGNTTALSGSTLSDGSIRHDTDSARLAQLWAATDRAIADDNLTLADQYLQEALELKPSDTILWSRAAELKLKLLEPALAENYAAKSNSFAAENKTLLHRNWLIIEHAREMRGDLLGVRDAHKMVQLYQY